MEQDIVAGLYHSLGVSVGAEFSSEDVSLLYHKVFHAPSNSNDAHAAMKKIAGDDNSWSCVGKKVLDVLLEMQKENDRKEELYWDLQLLNVGKLNTLYVTEKPVIINPHVQKYLRQSTDQYVLNKAHDPAQRERLEGRKELKRSMRSGRRLRKAARHCWARLASEGVQSILHSPLQDQSLEVRGQAWGCVSLSDFLLLVEVKYDVVTHLLYTEMLQEHYTLSVWETMLPWQQHKEEEGLEDLSEEALESGDMLRLAELPGAFRIYRACLGSPFRIRCESRAQSWSAVSFLYELHRFRQQERDTLTVLGKRLDRESLSLLCLYIRLATVRAQRETMSYAALLAARQSWETWPHVNSPCRVEQASMWLHDEEEGQRKDFISSSPQQGGQDFSLVMAKGKALQHLYQQAVLQLLVLTQEQERKHLVKLVHGVSLSDLQEPGCTVPPKEDSREQAALRNGCKKRLRQIRAGLRTHDDTLSPLKQSNTQLQLQAQTGMLEHCSLLLLTHLIELQEVQASALLPALMDQSAQQVQALRDDYEFDLEAQRYTNALQLLTSDAPLTSGSVLTPYPDFDGKSSEQIEALPCCSSGPLHPQSTSVRRASRELHRVQTAYETDTPDVCSGCGVVVEDLPYLEILCVSDATSSNDRQSRTTEGQIHQGEEEREVSATKIPQSYEKQGSLITLAWSKPLETDTDYQAEAAARGTEQSQDPESSLKTQVQPRDKSTTAELRRQCEEEETSGESDGEEQELRATLLYCDSTVHPPDQQCSTVGQLTLGEKAEAAQPEKGESVSHCDFQEAQPHLLLDSLQIKLHAGEICSSLTSQSADVDREMLEVEMCPTAAESEPWDLRGPQVTHTQDVTVDCSPAEKEAMRESMMVMERERAREPVSAVERERTMRNLVDMQKKVERRQQRDKERQLLRVQERLSIIQNRKAEEDLLGLKHTERLRHLTQDLPQEDRKQKTVVRERLEQLRRERSCVMQSKRDRNTAGFKELLGPVTLPSRELDETAD